MGLLNNPRPSAAAVVHLADYRVPSHRRRAAPALSAPGLGAWAQAAQARASTRAHASAHLPPPGAAQQPQASGAVRVTRFAEAANASGPVRHLRICGRLTDVCAELDRLVAAEARHGAQSRRA
ncbi:MAG TPA: hypothetical protein PLK10_05380 [Ottowia sp.]|nr:hypothetical protein [Ottowia sp.]